MTILNVMLGKGRGGLEQAALDYAQALREGGIPHLTLVTAGSWIETALTLNTLPYERLPYFHTLDPRAILYVRRLAASQNIRAALCHGNRALRVIARSLKRRASVIAVAHNASIRRFTRADHCFVVAQHLAEPLRAVGVSSITHIPNCIAIPPERPRHAAHVPPVIGALGRLDSKKGFDLLLDALAVLAQRGITFRAILGGEGQEQATLQARAEAYGIAERLQFPGWITDKERFFDGIDVFVMPSRSEAFGLTLAEAMAHGVPAVTSDALGPREVSAEGTYALLVRRGDAEAMADAIADLLAHPEKARALAVAARTHVVQEFSPSALAQRLQIGLAPYIGA